MTPPMEIRRTLSFASAGDELMPVAQDPVNWMAPNIRQAIAVSQTRLVQDNQVGCVVEVRPDGALLLRVSIKPARAIPFPELARRLFAFLGERRVARPPAKWECRWVPGGWCHFTTLLRSPQPTVRA
jgi:hypothetical protein